MRLSNMLAKSKQMLRTADNKHATTRSIKVGRSMNHTEANSSRILSAKERHAALLHTVKQQAKNSSIALNSKLMAGKMPTNADLNLNMDALMFDCPP